MPALEEPIKVFIVQRLACYDTPTQVADAVKEEFGVKVSRQQVEEYDPMKRCTTTKWVNLHAATRLAFEEETAKEPASLRAVRIRRLARMAERAEGKANYILAASLYEQIAKEKGDYFTNTRKLSHDGAIGGGVLAVPVPLSDCQWSTAATSQQTMLMKKPAQSTQGVEP